MQDLIENATQGATVQTSEPPVVRSCASYDAFSAFRARRRFGSLDGIRGLSVLAVVYHHSGPRISWLPMTTSGFLGVDMFFILSGFLIVTLLLRERDQHGAISLGRFYARRACRILPPLFGMLAALACFYAVKRGDPQAIEFWRNLPYYLTFTANFSGSEAANLGILWTLAAEEQFYLLWPAAERFLSLRAVRTILIVVVVAALAASVWGAGIPFYGPFGTLRVDLRTAQITYFPIWLGVILAHFLHVNGGFSTITRALGRRGVPLGCACLLLILANALGCTGARGDVNTLVRWAIQGTMAVFLASTVVREDTAIFGVLKWRPLARLGTISYGAYLFHMWGIDVARRGVGLGSGEASLALFGLGMALTVVLAEASYRWYESPILRFKTPFAR